MNVRNSRRRWCIRDVLIEGVRVSGSPVDGRVVSLRATVSPSGGVTVTVWRR